jgi:hypothetical protein
MGARVVLLNQNRMSITGLQRLQEIKKEAEK